MRDILIAVETPAIWIMFFLTSVYGHVALKLAVDRVHGGTPAQVLHGAATTFWGWSAVLAWTLSCVLWALAISRHRLVTANCISSFRYILVCLVAWWLLKEHVSLSQGLGIALIAGGILLVR